MKPNFICYILITCVILSTFGCAALSPKQMGLITSTPDGARVYFYEEGTNKEVFIGTTPTSAYLQQGLWDTYLIVKKTGYETSKILLDRSGSISNHFVLVRSAEDRISEESHNFSKDFKKRVAHVLGTYDKVLNSPRMLASSVASEGRSELQDLILDFPNKTDTATVNELKILSSTIESITNLPSAYYGSSVERNRVVSASEIMSKIKIGLGLNF